MIYLFLQIFETAQTTLGALRNNTIVLEICMSRVLAKASSKPGKQRVSLSPVTRSTFRLFTRSRRLMKIVLRCPFLEMRGPQPPQKTFRGETHPKYRAAYSANCFFQQTCFARLQRKR